MRILQRPRPSAIFVGKIALLASAFTPPSPDEDQPTSRKSTPSEASIFDSMAERLHRAVSTR